MEADRRTGTEVFPVGFLAGGKEIWLAWESVESGDRFLQDEPGLLRAESLAEISGMIMSAYDGVSVEGETFYDMDGCLIALREGRAQNAELVVEVWNILSDLSSTILGERRKFHPEHADSYDAFFSQCEVAGFVGMAPEPISKGDITNAIAVLESGVTLVLGVADNSYPAPITRYDVNRQEH